MYPAQGASLAALDRRFGLSRELRRLEQEGLLRRRLAIATAQGPSVRLDGREYLNFSSNDYLGLAADPEIVSAMAEGAARYGAGAGASPLVCGRLEVHEQLETELAAWLRRDRAILFSSGYLANLAIVSTFARRGGLVAQDRLAHASLIDGAVLARARLRRYPHRDAAALAALLDLEPGEKLVLTDGLFSMDGDRAPVKALASTCAGAEALLGVDDAHGIGVLGPGGGGVLEEAGASQGEVPILVGTFGKAFGAGGAFVAGPALIIEFLIQRARPYIYSTALSPALAAAALTALRRIRQAPELRERLKARIAYLQDQLHALGLAAGETGSPIQPVITGTPESAVAAAAALRDAGILVMPIRPPTVPKGTARLRITVSAAHEERHIDRLVEALTAWRARR